MSTKTTNTPYFLLFMALIGSFLFSSCSNLDIVRNDTDFFEERMESKGNKSRTSTSITDRILDMFGEEANITNSMSITYEVALKQFAIMPLISADKAGGTIITDWYSISENLNERFKFNIFILNENMEDTSINITMFKEVYDGAVWKPEAINDNTSEQIKKLILKNSRQLRATIDLS